MSLNRSLGGVLLIVGTAVGSGMLALPVETAALGFQHTILLFLICWCFMTLSALFLLEGSMVAKPGSNLLRMAEQLLGKGGKYFALLNYLLLMYALCAAYLSGLADWLLEGGLTLFALELSFPTAALLASLFIGICIVSGVWLVDHINRLFMLGLILAFLLLLVLVSPHVQLEHFQTTAPLELNKLSLIITSFGFHIVIPSLVSYIGPSRTKLIRVVSLGSFFSLAFYLLWQWLIMGAFPLKGEGGLLQLQQQGHPTADLTVGLHVLTGATHIATAMRTLAFSVLITSFLGVALSLFDCLQDTFQVKPTFFNRIITAVLTLTPPLLFAVFFSKGFILALHLAGIFVAILLGILPAAMIFSARYVLHTSQWATFWGKPLFLIVTFFFFIGVIGIEITHLL